MGKTKELSVFECVCARACGSSNTSNRLREPLLGQQKASEGLVAHRRPLEWAPTPLDTSEKY